MSDTQTQLGEVDPTAAVAPPSFADNAYALAWEDSAAPAEVDRRPLPRRLLALLGFVGVAALVLGAYVTGARAERRAAIAQIKPVIETETVTETPSAAEVLNAQNDKILDAVRKDRLPVTSEADITVVNARGFCDYLASGHRTLADQDGFVLGLYPTFTPGDVGSFEGLAVGIMCPRFASLYQPSSDGTS